MKNILFLFLVLLSVSVSAFGQSTGQGFTPSVGGGAGAVDSTRLLKDSIQVYYLNGVEVRRDTIRVRGVGGGRASFPTAAEGQSFFSNGTSTVADYPAVQQYIPGRSELYAEGTHVIRNGVQYTAARPTSQDPENVSRDWRITNNTENEQYKSLMSQNIGNAFANTDPVIGLVITDSNGERTGSWVYNMMRNLQVTHGAGGIGYLPPFADASTIGWGFYVNSKTPGWAEFDKGDISTVTNNPFGRKIVSSDPTQTITYEPNPNAVFKADLRLSNRFEIYSLSNGASYEYSINGGTSFTTVNTGNTGGLHTESVLPGLTTLRVERSVVIRPLTGELHHCGVSFLNHLGGRSSATLHSLAISGSGTRLFSGIDEALVIDAIQALAPDFVILSHGTNDQNLGAAGALSQQSLDDHATGMQTIIDRIILATGVPPIITTQVSNEDDLTVDDKLSDYAIIDSRIAQKNKCFFIDINDIFNSEVHDPGLFADNPAVHYTSQTNVKIAGINLNKIGFSVISSGVASRFDTGEPGNEKMIFPKNDVGLGLGKSRVGFGFSPSSPFNLQIIPEIGGRGINIDGSDIEHGIYVQNDNANANRYAGYFINDTPGTALYARSRGTAFSIRSTGTASGYGFDVSANFAGGRIRSRSTPLVTERTVNSSSITTSLALSNATGAEVSGVGTSILFRDRIGGANGEGGSTNNRVRLISQLTDAGTTAEYGIAVRGSGVASNLLTPQYRFGGGTNGLLSVPGLELRSSATESLNFPSTPGVSTSTLTVTLPGAAIGDVVVLGTPHAATEPNSSYFAWVSSTDTVSIRFLNHAATAADPISADFTVKILK